MTTRLAELEAQLQQAHAARRAWAEAHPMPAHEPGATRRQTAAKRREWQKRYAAEGSRLGISQLKNEIHALRFAPQHEQRRREQIAALEWAAKQTGTSSWLLDELRDGDDVAPGAVHGEWLRGALAFLHRHLLGNGWRMYHKSNSGSRYYVITGGGYEVALRVSDHGLGYADYGQGRAQRHDGPELIFEGIALLTEAELLEELRAALEGYTWDAV